MKRILSLTLLLSSLFAQAQNMVSNPSFESYETCPGSPAPFVGPTMTETTVLEWFQPTSGSADYFNSCSPPPSGNSVPTNFMGYQLPRTGNGYAGIHSIQITGASEPEQIDYAEYIETQLSSTLTNGHRYFVSYWVSLADFRNLGITVGVDQMGALFKNTYIDIPDDYSPLIETPQVVSPVGQIFADTTAWQKVEGLFTAAGTENWMIIGNFIDYDLLAKDTIFSDGIFQQQVSYYYIEDVCVIDLEGSAENTFTHDTTLCMGAPFQLTPTDTLGGYIWDNGSTGIARSINLPGKYWVKSVNLNTCSLRIDTFNIYHERKEIPVSLGNDTSFCIGVPFTVDAYKDDFENYRWNTGETTSEIAITYAGKYYVTATSDCYIGTDTIIVKVVPKPEVQLPDDTLVCIGTPVDISYPQTGNHYYWSTGSETCCITIDEPGTYTLTLTNICGESSSDDIVVAQSRCDHCILAPTAFSPNGDGLNDQFEIHVNCLMKEYKLSIFNRWGQVVFSTVKPDRHWDGMMNGTPADQGVYFYYIEAIPAIKDLKKIVEKGDLTLIR